MRRILLPAVIVMSATLAAPANDPNSVPEDFPRFRSPGHEQALESLRALYWNHYPELLHQPTMWDEWLVAPTLWPAVDSDPRGPAVAPECRKRLYPDARGGG